jgi:hypothetical protein
MSENEQKRSYYAIIPADVRYDKKITANAKLLYGEITALSNEKGYCWATNDYFSKLYGVSKNSISRWVQSLISGGYIKSQLLYADDSMQIKERRLYISDTKKNDTYQQKHIEPISKNEGRGIIKNGEDNITLINNTINSKEEEDFQLYGDLSNVRLKESEYKKLLNDYGKTITEKYINKLSLYEKIDKYTDHNRTIRKWLNNDGIEKKQNIYIPPELQKVGYVFEVQNDRK